MRGMFVSFVLDWFLHREYSTVVLGSTVKEDAARCLDRNIILDFGVSNDFLLCCIGETLMHMFLGGL